MQSLTLPIACAIDNSYALPLAVMLESLKQHLLTSFKPKLYLIHTGIPQVTLDAISSIVETHSIIPTALQLSTAPYDHHFPREAAFPLLLPELLPTTLERVLFLDADLLVMDDLAKLWETPMNHNVLAGVTDSAVPLCSASRGVKGWQALGIPAKAPYFNGGVLLIHLARWQEGKVTGCVHQYLETTTGPIDFLHQEALNAVLWDAWQNLDSRWNLLASHAGRLHDRSGSQDWRHPGIVHFAGRMKPWRSPIGGPFNAPYQEVLRRVLPLIPAQAPSLRDRLQSKYDRFFRAAFYPLEQYLWRKRLL